MLILDCLFGWSLNVRCVLCRFLKFGTGSCKQDDRGLATNGNDIVNVIETT